ncbi:hypothetical protein SDC9_150229 [bioreactor metagenome]|uniref:Uncharacterized protein n=1 Tax=bioreactor metagenome TaxID=1076179 RepID=A0A645ENI4_9ZZZZ
MPYYTRFLRGLRERRCQVVQTGAGGGPHFVDQLARGIAEKVAQADLGLGDDGYRPGCHRVERHRHPGFGQRRADDHRRRVFLHDLAQETEAIHARHLDVENDHVGPVAVEFFHREQGVRRCRDDLDVVRLGQNAAQHFTNDGRVVDDMDGDFPIHG